MAAGDISITISFPLASAGDQVKIGPAIVGTIARPVPSS